MRGGLCVSVGQFVFVNSHAASRDQGRASNPAMSVPVSCVRTPGEIDISNVRVVNTGSWNHDSALKKR